MINNAENRADKLLLRLRNLEDVRRDYETGTWSDITKYVNPRREDILANDYTKTKGQRKGKDAYDGTPNAALNTWADGMQGHLVSEHLNWFLSRMSVDWLNDMDEVLLYLQEYDRVMYSAFAKSNFYSAIPLWFRDAGSIGTGTLYTEEDLVERRAVHTVIHPREIFIAENKYGDVDTVFRKFQMTARNAIERFGKEHFSESFMENAKTNPEKPWLFVHAVYPNNDVLFGDNKGRPFRSEYVIVEGEYKNTPNNASDTGKSRLISEGGYKLNPYAVWRFRKNSDEVYGYSPAADALVEIMGSNQLTKTMFKAAQMAVESPLNVPIEMRGNVRIEPKGYNYYDDPSRVITPINSGVNYPIGVDREDKLRQSIENRYFVQFFLMLERATREMTATEIVARENSTAVQIGPQVDSLFRDGLSKVFNIVSDIEDRFGSFDYLPSLPIEAEDAEITIVLNGPLAQSQRRLFRMRPIRDSLSELAPWTTMFPEIRYKVKPMAIADEILEAGNFPERLTNSDDEAMALYQQELQQKAQMQQQQMLLEAAKVAPKLGNKVDESSLLAKAGV